MAQYPVKDLQAKNEYREVWNLETARTTPKGLMVGNLPKKRIFGMIGRVSISTILVFCYFFIYTQDDN